MDQIQSEALADLGHYIRAQRELAQLSLRHLARVSAISDSYLSQIERGKYQPSGEVLTALAKALNIAPDTLFRRLGWLPANDVQTEDRVADALAADTRLNAAQRSALLQTYRAMVQGQ